MIDYKKTLKESFFLMNQFSEGFVRSRLEFLSEYIFDFTTYDSDTSELLGKKAIEVIKAITDQSTYEYINTSKENYQWYIIMCNMPFFQGKLDWGTSIRGAWWDYDAEFELDSCGLFINNQQIIKPLSFSHEEWVVFIKAVCEFATPTPDNAPSNQS